MYIKWYTYSITSGKSALQGFILAGLFLFYSKVCFPNRSYIINLNIALFYRAQPVPK